ncbi:tetratricopeptide repeat protein [Actinokineospora bangkokensis]|uniref:Tetratricopeptide repeat protein n=1 Tax=Actinokineospora bangkokensis TaxID=1193682 RepID=A0A1Q9LQ65_9PSEU|nr:hypothetical protein [Actinokineospora bangkokensis]OLR94141.1 hypothetical protein BJP25_10030 [Actinokineospora bangkokensis]
MSSRTVSIILTAVLVVYFVLLGGRAVALFRDGSPIAVGLGVGVIILPVVGVWIAWSTFRFGVRTEKLARALDAEGGLPDTSDLPRMPSGRVDRTAADAWFETQRAEVEQRPEDWRSWYRLAVAYDVAGDRSRAREAMRKALDLAGV